MLKSGEPGDGQMQKTLALCVNWASGQCANHLGRNACTEAGSERVRRCDHWHGRAQVSQGLNCVAGAVLWQAQHFRKVKYRTHGRRSTFVRCLCELEESKMQKRWRCA